MTVIKEVKAREVLDSRGNPTVEVDVLAGDVVSRAVVPSGASTGKYEALELRDGGKRYNGKGVLKAVGNVNTIIKKKLVGLDCRKQHHIDSLLIKIAGENKKKLGANAVLGVSMAVCRAGAAASNVHLFEYIRELSGRKVVGLPVPFCNVINGGKHAGNELAIQEFMIAPVGHSESFSEGIRAVAECYHGLRNLLEQKYGKSATNVGDEGGFAPDLKTAEEALQLLETAIGNAGYKDKVRIAVDAAASEFYKDGSYYLPKEMKPQQLLQYYLDLIREYKIISVEDPFEQDSFESFAWLTEKSKIQVIGDDLLVTNVERIKRAIKFSSCNCLLLKLNQIGTITEALDAANLAFKNKWKVMVSHRSGETEDPFIADLAVGLGCGMIKSGAPCRGERTAKYNQLLRIEELLR